MKKNLFSKAIIISTAVLCFLSVACSSSHEKDEKETTTAPAHIETFVLKKGDLETTLRIPAELISFKQVDLYAKVNSYVKSLQVDVGSSVKKGQLLATLDAPELISQVSASESKYKAQQAVFLSSSATYKRILETSATPGTISKNDVEVALAKRNSDEAQLAAAKAEFLSNSTITSYLNIYAPFDGVISTRNVNLGAYIGPSGKGSELPIFTLSEARLLRLIISVPDSYKSYIKLKDVVKFNVRAFPDQIFSGKIARRAGVMDRQLRSEHVEVDVPNDDMKLSPGMIAEAIINLQGEHAFLVPKTAVVNSTEGAFVIQSLNNQAKRIPVRMGRITDSVVEVFSTDLREGSTYVVKASEEIRADADLR